MEIAAIAAGEIIGKTQSAAELGVMFTFTGFLARKSRNSKSLVFHITDFAEHMEQTLDTGAKHGIR